MAHSDGPKLSLRSIRWLLALTLIALAGGFVAFQYMNMIRVAEAISPGGTSAVNGRGCVETYGITLHTSWSHVREYSLLAPRQGKNAPNEEATVLRGMARNGCGEPLRNVRVKINVRDASGSKGSGWADVGVLAIGQVRSFEKAWMGRVTSYEVVEIR